MSGPRIAGEHLTGTEMAEQLSRVLGEPVDHRPLEPADYRGLGVPGADDLSNMFQFYRDFADEFAAARDLDEVRRLHPGRATFRDWLEQNKNRIPLG